jgi:hypothetical protein
LDPLNYNGEHDNNQEAKYISKITAAPAYVGKTNLQLSHAWGRISRYCLLRTDKEASQIIA